MIYKENMIKQKKAEGGKKNILVVGGAGFIGSHLCEELVKENNVICVDDFITSDVENIRFLMAKPNFAFIKHDIAEPLVLEEIRELEKFEVKVFGVQEIYNLACPTSARKFDSLVMKTLLTNSQGTKNVLDLAVKYDAQVVHASSAVVYGARVSNNYVPESFEGSADILSPRSCYDEGKRFAESMIATYNNFHHKNFKIARIFRTYGPRLMLNDGQMISDFILNALENKDLIIYGGEDFSTSLLYVSDVVDGLIKLMKSDFGGAINLGSEVDVLLKDVAKQIIVMTDSSSKVVYKENLPFITSLPLPDISQAKAVLGWYPVTTLEQGLKKTLEYTRANKALLTNSMNETNS